MLLFLALTEFATSQTNYCVVYSNHSFDVSNPLALKYQYQNYVLKYTHNLNLNNITVSDEKHVVGFNFDNNYQKYFIAHNYQKYFIDGFTDSNHQFQLNIHTKIDKFNVKYHNVQNLQTIDIFDNIFYISASGDHNFVIKYDQFTIADHNNTHMYSYLGNNIDVNYRPEQKYFDITYLPCQIFYRQFNEDKYISFIASRQNFKYSFGYNFTNKKINSFSIDYKISF